VTAGAVSMTMQQSSQKSQNMSVCDTNFDASFETARAGITSPSVCLGRHVANL
jgi:hypothetical protein